MKIAISISGQLRAWEQSYKSLKENVLDHNDCQLFIQTYDTPEARKMIDVVRPDVVLLEQPIQDFTIPDKVREHKAPETNIDNMYWMYRNIKRCNDLFTPDDPFDAVFRTRFDLIYPHQINLSELDPTKLWVPSGGNHHGGLFDMVAYGNHEVMDRYCSVIDHIEEYVDSGVMAHPETLLRHHLQGTEVVRFTFPIHVIRDYGLWLATA